MAGFVGVQPVHSIVAAEEERHGETKREKRRLEEEIKDYQVTPFLTTNPSTTPTDHQFCVM
jgi:hypothetical protein